MELTLPRREEEVRKKITAMLLGGPAMVLLDNVDRALDSGSLAAALTRDRWADRLLGQSTVVPRASRASLTEWLPVPRAHLARARRAVSRRVRF